MAMTGSTNEKPKNKYTWATYGLPPSQNSKETKDHSGSSQKKERKKTINTSRSGASTIMAMALLLATFS